MSRLLDTGLAILDRIDAAKAGSANDLRVRGWSVAAHNDYRQNGEAFTFWLMTKQDRALKGEGRTDAEALNQIRTALEEPRDD